MAGSFGAEIIYESGVLLSAGLPATPGVPGLIDTYTSMCKEV